MWPYSSEERDWLNADTAPLKPTSDPWERDVREMDRLVRRAHFLRARACADGLAAAARWLRRAPRRLWGWLAWILYPAYRDGTPPTR